jgi:hypothetical protein
MMQYQLGSGSDGCELGRAMQPRPGEVKDSSNMNENAPCVRALCADSEVKLM